MKIATSLEEVLNTRKQKQSDNGPDSYEDYKRKNGLLNTKSYIDAINALYAASKKNLSSYGINNREINNKGLQNSGYASYIDSMAQNSFEVGIAKIKKSYSEKENEYGIGYLDYLEKYKSKENRIANSVMSHLVKNNVVDINTAIAYGISAGLSNETAQSTAQSAYEITKQKVFNSILEQTVRLGLDKEGAKLLALKMGISENDALDLAEEVGELLKYYGSISEDYLEFLEGRTN